MPDNLSARSDGHKASAPPLTISKKRSTGALDVSTIKRINLNLAIRVTLDRKRGGVLEG